MIKKNYNELSWQEAISDMLEEIACLFLAYHYCKALRKKKR